MQLAQDKRPAQMDRQARTPSPLSFSNKPIVPDQVG